MGPEILGYLQYIPVNTLAKLYERPAFIIHNKLIKLYDFINSYGNYSAFINSKKNLEDDMTQLKMIYKYDKNNYNDKLNYCLVGKIGYIDFFINECKWIYKYFKKRSDLDIIRRIYVTGKKAIKNIFIFNYNTCIDIKDYFDDPELYNKRIKRKFDENIIDRINLYKYIEV